MLPIPRQQSSPGRANSVSSYRSDYDRWSQWTQEEEEPLSPTLPGEDLADLVRKSQLALSSLDRETPNSPIRYQDDHGSIYYEYDDDWVSTISPIDRAPSRRFNRVPSFFGRGGQQYQSMPSTEAEDGAPPSRLQSSGSMARRVPSSVGNPWQRMSFRNNSTRLGHRVSSHPSTISEGLEMSREPTEVSFMSHDDEASEPSLSDIKTTNTNNTLDQSFGPGITRALGVQTRRPMNESDAGDLPSYRPNDDMSTSPASLPTIGTAKHQVSSGVVDFPSEHKMAITSVAVEPYGDGGDGSRSPPLSPPSKEDIHGPEAVAPVSGLGLVAMTFALSLAVFIVGVDINIVSTAIPEITADFGSVEDIGWYGSAFLLTTCAFQIPWGRLYTLLSTKWTFTAATIIFELGSLICAASQSSIAFIVGRAVQGMGVSGMLSGALIIMSLVVPLPKRSLLGGIIGAMEGVAMISAPLIGGVLTDNLNWRWCFWINLPIGAVVLIVIILFLNVPPQPLSPEVRHMTFTQRLLHILQKLDLVGTAILIPCIVCLLLAMHWGGTKYDWNSLGIILLFVLSLVLLGIFVYMQRQKGENAMVPPRIIKQRTILAGFWFMLCTSSALVVMTYFVSTSKLHVHAHLLLINPEFCSCLFGSRQFARIAHPSPASICCP